MNKNQALMMVGLPADTWYSNPCKKRNIRQTEKQCPRRRSPHLHSIQADTSPAVVDEDLTVEELQTPTITQTPKKPMIIEEGHPVPAPTTNTSASFHIPRIIIQEALQSVTFDVMTHLPSEFTPITMKQSYIS